MNRRPTGFISEIANLVPACGKCNQSKGNKPWREWMQSAAALSPTGRNKPDVQVRIARLETFERWRAPTCVDFVKLIGADAWEEYWSLCESVVAELERSQVVANRIREAVKNAVSSTPPSSTTRVSSESDA